MTYLKDRWADFGLVRVRRIIDGDSIQFECQYWARGLGWVDSLQQARSSWTSEEFQAVKITLNWLGVE